MFIEILLVIEAVWSDVGSMVLTISSTCKKYLQYNWKKKKLFYSLSPTPFHMKKQQQTSKLKQKQNINNKQKQNKP